jgi:hypothetical protein
VQEGGQIGSHARHAIRRPAPSRWASTLPL